MLKVDFASDNKNGTNLKKNDIMYRDMGEIVNISGDYMTPTESTAIEII